jgi:hypothetical protein
LKIGERLTTRIEGIGALINLAVPEAEWVPATSAAPLADTALRQPV